MCLLTICHVNQFQSNWRWQKKYLRMELGNKTLKDLYLNLSLKINLATYCTGTYRFFNNFLRYRLHAWTIDIGIVRTHYMASARQHWSATLPSKGESMKCLVNNTLLNEVHTKFLIMTILLWCHHFTLFSNPSWIHIIKVNCHNLM